MTLISTLKTLVATISATILTVLGLSTPVVSPEMTVGTPIVEIATTTAEVSTITQEIPKTKEKTAIQEAYEIGKSIGYIESKLEQIESQIPTTTTPMIEPTPIPQPEPTPTLVPSNPSPLPNDSELQLISEPQPISQPQNMSSLKIISPMSNKGLGRTYRAGPQVVDESNYIVIGLLVKDDVGEVTKDVVVEVSATDATQNKTISGTGNITKIFENGSEKTVYYYPYTYEFKTAGKHTITFKTLGLTESVELDVLEAESVTQ